MNEIERIDRFHAIENDVINHAIDNRERMETVAISFYVLGELKTSAELTQVITSARNTVYMEYAEGYYQNNDEIWELFELNKLFDEGEF